MEEFYRRLQAGMARANALKTKYFAPLYWGAFISQGDPRALPQAPGQFQ